MTRLRLSLRQRLLLLVLLALLPTLAVIGYNELNLRRSRTQEVNEQAMRSALLATSELQRIVEGVDKLLLAIGQIPEIQALNADVCRNYLENLQPKVEHLVGISVVDAEANLRCRTTMPAQPVSYADRGYVQEALQSGRFAIGEYVTGRVSGRPVLPVAQPFKDPSGKLVGAVLAGIDLRWLADRLRERGLPPGGALTVADRTGVIISREPFPDRFVGTKIPQDFMRLVHGSAPGAEAVLSQDGTQRILGYVPVVSTGVGLYVSAGLSYENSFAAIERGSRIGLVIALAGGLVAFLAAWLAGQRFLQYPIDKIVHVLEAWRGGDREARTHYRAEDGEIGALGAALDRLMDEIVQRQGERELLVHELDHRVKNNFAVIHSVASRTLRNAGVEPSIIRKLGDRIVALSRAHDLLTRENFESATVQELVEGAIATQTPEWDARIWRSGPVVRLDPRASLGLAMALHELLTNAVKYGALANDSGRVILTWSLEAQGTGAACAFEWEEAGGPPVQAPDARGFGSQLLERSVRDARFDFRREGLVCSFRVDVSRPRSEPGTAGGALATA
jgi:two-component sensor histidine kinase